MVNGTPPADSATNHQTVKHPWEYVDEIVSILKTAYPLLALNLETMVDQLSQRFRSSPEEEIYRFTYMLLQDGVQVCTCQCSMHIGFFNPSFRRLALASINPTTMVLCLK